MLHQVCTHLTHESKNSRDRTHRSSKNELASEEFENFRACIDDGTGNDAESIEVENDTQENHRSSLAEHQVNYHADIDDGSRDDPKELPASQWTNVLPISATGGHIVLPLFSLRPRSSPVTSAKESATRKNSSAPPKSLRDQYSGIKSVYRAAERRLQSQSTEPGDEEAKRSKASRRRSSAAAADMFKHVGEMTKAKIRQRVRKIPPKSDSLHTVSHEKSENASGNDHARQTDIHDSDQNLNIAAQRSHSTSGTKKDLPDNQTPSAIRDEQARLDGEPDSNIQAASATSSNDSRSPSVGVQAYSPPSSAIRPGSSEEKAPSANKPQSAPHSKSPANSTTKNADVCESVPSWYVPPENDTFLLHQKPSQEIAKPVKRSTSRTHYTNGYPSSVKGGNTRNQQAEIKVRNTHQISESRAADIRNTPSRPENPQPTSVRAIPDDSTKDTVVSSRRAFDQSRVSYAGPQDGKLWQSLSTKHAKAKTSAASGTTAEATEIVSDIYPEESASQVRPNRLATQDWSYPGMRERVAGARGRIKSANGSSDALGEDSSSACANESSMKVIATADVWSDDHKMPGAFPTTSPASLMSLKSGSTLDEEPTQGNGSTEQGSATCEVHEVGNRKLKRSPSLNRRGSSLRARSLSEAESVIDDFLSNARSHGKRRTRKYSCESYYSTVTNQNEDLSSSSGYELESMGSKQASTLSEETSSELQRSETSTTNVSSDARTTSSSSPRSPARNQRNRAGKTIASSTPSTSHTSRSSGSGSADMDSFRASVSASIRSSSRPSQVSQARSTSALQAWPELPEDEAPQPPASEASSSRRTATTSSEEEEQPTSRDREHSCVDGSTADFAEQSVADLRAHANEPSLKRTKSFVERSRITQKLFRKSRLSSSSAESEATPTVVSDKTDGEAGRDSGKWIKIDAGWAFQRYETAA